MTTPDRLDGVLETLFAELADCRAWQADLRRETAGAVHRRAMLTGSLRALIEALPPRARRAPLDRLCAMTGGRPRPARGNARPTGRTRTALAWLAARDPAEFHTAELRAHLAPAASR